MINDEEKEDLMQPTEQARKLIADYSADFLRTRMQLTRDILKRCIARTITLTEYINGVDKIKEDDRRAYRETNMHRVEVTDEEIEELVGLVHESLTKYSIGDTRLPSNFVYLIKKALDNLLENIADDVTISDKVSKLELLKKWGHMADGEWAFAIDSRIAGSVSWRDTDEFRIQNINSNLVAKIGLDGTDKMISQNIPKGEDDVLVASNIVFGYILIEQGENKAPEKDWAFFLKKVVDGKTVYKKLFGDNNIYTLSDAFNFRFDFDALLFLSDLDYLSEDYYNRDTFERALLAFQRQNTISDDEKEKIEKAIAIAVDWWADAIKSSPYNNGEPILSCSATTSLSTRPAPEDEKIELFKHYLRREIKANLMAYQREFSLSVDYGPCRCLSKAADKAKLNVVLPWKTSMWISPEKVSVRQGYGAGLQVLYDANQNYDNNARDRYVYDVYNDYDDDNYDYDRDRHPYH